MNQEQLLDAFEYSDGVLRWKRNRGKVKAGAVAGHAKPGRYIEIHFNGKMHKAHRLIFLMHHGWLPDLIDHINGIKTDNRIENLRAADKSLNSYSRPPPRTNSSGVVGVKWQARDKAWQAQITKNGVRHYLGYYKDKSDAINSRRLAEISIYGEPHMQRGGEAG